MSAATPCLAPVTVLYGAAAPAVRAGRGAAGAASAQWRADAPLRLNNVGFALPAPGSLNARGRSPKALLLDHLIRLCEPWDAAAHSFLRRYFDFLARQTEQGRASIEASLMRFGGLFVPDDMVFSALAPLPRAHLPMPGPDAHEPIPVDFAFWDGRAPSVALALPSKLTPGRSRERLRRLEAAGIAVAHFAPAATLDEDDGLFGTLLGPRFVRFFDTERVPCGPVDTGFVTI